MPYIIMKRDDIPEGLQVLDLKPNTSQRRFPYLNPGQTKYANPVARQTPRLATLGGVVTFGQEAAGLEAWLLTNVNDGTGAAASGTATLTTVLVGHTFTIGTTPAFTLTAAASRTPGNLDFDQSGTDIADATSMVAAIMDDTNWAAAGLTRPVVADNAGGTSNIVTITALADGTAGNYTLSQTGGTIAVVGMAGGLDADSLTAAEAVQNADDILGLLAFGDNATPASALTVGAINGALTTGSITAAQLSEVLDILSGRPYTVPAGVQIEAASAFGVSPAVGEDGGPSFGPVRHTYETGQFRMSAGEGMLAGYSSPEFSYAGVEARAIVLYNDDGTIYVP